MELDRPIPEFMDRFHVKPQGEVLRFAWATTLGATTLQMDMLNEQLSEELAVGISKPL